MNAPSLEDRVRNLERFRYRMLGETNAYRTLLLDAWMQLIEKVPDPVGTAEDMKRIWLSRVDTPAIDLTGIDPVHIDLVSQETSDALGQLTDLLIQYARQAKSASEDKG
ncbi:hypothetical protein [Enterovirga sp. CN4-39]|uniref:hypothetical protein n=1 Tax=Enterovirga sp. CN4-39 TaxID=3400910 RepID=UPI003C0A5087